MKRRSFLFGLFGAVVAGPIAAKLPAPPAPPTRFLILHPPTGTRRIPSGFVSIREYDRPITDEYFDHVVQQVGRNMRDTQARVIYHAISGRYP